MQSILNELCLLGPLQDFHVVSVFVTTASTACTFQADLDNYARFASSWLTWLPNNKLVSFFHELACGSRCMAFSLSYLRQENLFTGYLTNEKQTGAEMRPQLLLRDSYWGCAGQLLANFFPVLSNNPRSLCDS